jgi:general L-amino acid transport system permease protein
MSDTHAHSVAFVRVKCCPPAAPPPGEAGPLRWVRENLLSSWFNAILTVVSLYLIFMILAGILPWTLNGIWNAGSLSECREIRNARGLESAACWAVINERWLQLLFGFYPTDDRLLASWFYAEQLEAAGGMEAVFGLGSNSTARIEFVGEMKRELAI